MVALVKTRKILGARVVTAIGIVEGVEVGMVIDTAAAEMMTITMEDRDMDETVIGTTDTTETAIMAVTATEIEEEGIGPDRDLHAALRRLAPGLVHRH